MEKRLLEIIACPICKGKLQYDKRKQELICSFDKLSFPVKDGIPVMLPDKARKIDG